MVDVRAPAEFSGELLAPANLPQKGAYRGGHIPGAANIPWLTAVTVEDGTFKSVEELQVAYTGKGISGDGQTVAYCRIGERSSHTWFYSARFSVTTMSRTTTVLGPSTAAL